MGIYLGIDSDGTQVKLLSGTKHGAPGDIIILSESVADAEVAAGLAQYCPLGEPLQMISDDSAISLTYGMVVIKKPTTANITGAAPIADGLQLRIVSMTNQAHKITFPAGTLVGSSGTPHSILTLVPGGAVLSACLVSHDGMWMAVTLTGGTLTGS